MRYIAGHHARTKGPEYIVDPVTKCWIWQHDRHNKESGGPYGRYNKGGDRRFSHVVFWEREYGPVPPGKELHHLCVEAGHGTTLCCNPEHLEPVTHTENMRRGKSTLLTVAKVQAIKRQLNSGESWQKLARLYKVKEVTIAAIDRGYNWKDVKAS